MGRRTRTADAQGAREVLVAPTLGEGLDSPQLVVDETTGAWQAAFVYAGEYPLMRITRSGPVYYLHDGMGSVIGLADGSGSEVAEFRYDAFGVERSSTGSQAALPSSLGGDFRYHGQWQERATGLYFVRARNYDPGSGRFLSRDSIEGVFERPESFHPYTWNANNPSVYRDPTGRFTLVELSSTSAVRQNLSKLGLSNLTRGRVLDLARGTARHLAREIVQNTLTSLIPGAYLDPFAYAGELSSAVSDFDSYFRQKLCGFLKLDDVGLAGITFVEVPISGRKKGAQGDGLNCRFDDVGDAAVSAAGNRPNRFGGGRNTNSGSVDFYFKDGFPTDDSKKAFLIGEVKIRTSLFNKDKNKRQLDRMFRYAKYENENLYAPSTLLVALVESRGKEGRAAKRLIRAKATANGVWASLLTVF